MSKQEALEVIRGRLPGASARVGLILGSGLGGLADKVDGAAIDYPVIPGFPRAGVSGHAPKLVLGRLETQVHKG